MEAARRDRDRRSAGGVPALEELTAPGASAVEAGLVAVSRDALLFSDRNGKIGFANPAAGELLNTPPRSLSGRLLVSYIEPAHRRAFRSYLNRAETEETLAFATELAPRRMRPFPARVHVAHVADGLGWVVCEAGDAVEARPPSGFSQLEQAELGHVLEAVRDGVLVIDREPRVHFFNRAAQAMVAPQEVELGAPLPEPWRNVIRRLVDGLFEHEGHNAEAVIELERRTAVWIRAYRSGAGESAVLLLSDVTAEERRERAERDFVAHAAHELQSPLTGISGAIEVLLAGAHEDVAARTHFLGHIERENARLSRLLRSLLLLAQAHAADAEVAAEDFELRPLLLQVAAAESDGTRVEVVAPRLSVHAHRELVEHAISNLVTNAIRHGSGPRVILSARRAADGGVQVEVTDFGPGVAAEERLRVFERFYRGRTDVAGFGLGLSIAQQAARAVGGEVELRRNPRGGTIAVLTLRSAA